MTAAPSATGDAPGPATPATGEFTALLTSGHDGVALEDGTGRLRFANAALARLLGCASPEALLEGGSPRR